VPGLLDYNRALPADLMGGCVVCAIADTFSVLAVPFLEVEIQVEGVGLPRGDAELGFYNGALVTRLEWHI